LKRIFTFCAVAVLMLALLSGCRPDVATTLDSTEQDLEQNYLRYLNEDSPPKSVMDTLDMMLDHYVSGVAQPPQSSIPSNIIDPSDASAQTIIGNVSDIVSSEGELVSLIHDALQDLDESITFEASCSWLNDDVLYDVVFNQVDNVYMIDAFGLYGYKTSWTQSSSGNTVCSLEFLFIDDYTADEIRRMRQEIESHSKQIVRDLDLGNKTDYEKIAAIDQFLCDTVEYPEEPYLTLDHTPYGALHDGRAVCDGYSRAVKILCDLCGLECYFVVGYCGNDPVNRGHAWNLVKIEGEYYQLDTTWNDGSGTKDYLLVTDAFMTLSRTWDQNEYPPSAKFAYQP